MQTEDDKRLDQWTRKVLKETQLESPGSDFTNNIMSQIAPATDVAATSSYTPLITRKYWGLIASCSLALIVLAFFVKAENSLGVFQKIANWGSGITSIDLIPARLFPENMAYGMIALLFFLAIQILLLKQRHTRSLHL